MPYANNKGADQPAHPRSLISAFVVVRCLDSIIPLVSISKISSLYLASVAAYECTLIANPEGCRILHKAGFLVTWLIYILHITSFVQDNVAKHLEPCHEKTCFMPYANNKGVDQCASA